MIKTAKRAANYINKSGVKMEDEGFCLRIERIDPLNSGIEISLLLTRGPNVADDFFYSSMIDLITKRVASSDNYTFMQDGGCLVVRKSKGFKSSELQKISQEIKKINATHQRVLKMTKSLSKRLYNQEIAEQKKLQTKIEQIVNKL